MASELASLPAAVLNNVQTFTGNTHAGSVIVDGISNTSALQTGMIVSGPGIAVGAQIVFVSTTSIQLSITSTLTGTASLSAGMESYAASSIYYAIPQFLQDHDATTPLISNPAYTFLLYRFVKAMVSMLDTQVNAVVQASVGTNGQISDQYALAPGWSQLIDINRCPDWALPWLAQFVGTNFNNVDLLTTAQKVDKLLHRSNYRRGMKSTIQNAVTAEINFRFQGQAGFTPIQESQVFILEQTAPYTVSFLGSTTSGSASLTGVDTTGLFNGQYLTGAGIPTGTYIASMSGTTITMNKNATATASSILVKATSVNSYVSDPYGMVILVPNVDLFNYTYSTLNVGVTGTTNPTYLTLDTLLGIYANVATDPSPRSNTALASFLYNYRPAGVQVYVGGY